VPVSGAFADPRLLAGMAADAEEAGWDGFFLQDLLNTTEPVAEPWISLAAVALRTERIRIGIMLTPLTRRRPWQVARQAATIDNLSRGRLVFGAGLGYSAQDFTPFGEEWDGRVRASRLDEALEIVTGLWSGEPYSFAGAHHRIDDVTLRPAPVQSPRIPVWVAAGWPRRRPIERAARWDGVYLMTVRQDTREPLTPADVADAAAALRTAGRRPGFEIGFNAVRRGDGAAQVREFADAGGTWWVELADDEGGPEAYRRRIRSGPPAT